MHILVVEDDRPLARILRKSIESSGHTVDIVGDGDEGLRMARTRAHDALVLDLQLPRLSGIEVCRRLRALHRRGKLEPEILQSGPLELDTSARELRVNGTTVELTGTELALLEYLMRNPGVVLSRDQLREQVWGDGFEPASNVVDIYVHYVRRKLKKAGAEHDPIRTVRGLGYAFRRAD